jgi:hypothetical protein
MRQVLGLRVLRSTQASLYVHMAVLVYLNNASHTAAAAAAALDDKELVNALWLRGCTDAYYRCDALPAPLFSPLS